MSNSESTYLDNKLRSWELNEIAKEQATEFVESVEASVKLKTGYADNSDICKAFNEAMNENGEDYQIIPKDEYLEQQRSAMELYKFTKAIVDGVKDSESYGHDCLEDFVRDFVRDQEKFNNTFNSAMYEFE